MFESWFLTTDFSTSSKEARALFTCPSRATIDTMKRLLFFAVLVSLLNACSPISFVNAFVDTDLERTKNITYGPLERQKLDVYEAMGEVRGVLVFVHGGTWDSGDKSDYPFLADTLAECGYTTVVANYRLVPEVTFPSYAEDLALALDWVFGHQDLLGSERIFLMGHSAGAHIAALISFDERYLAAHALEPQDLSGFIGLAGPYDFLPPDPNAVRTRAALGPEENWQATQPINFVDGDEMPALLMTGLDDTMVNPANSERMAQRILEQGGEATLKTYEGVDHVAIVGAFARVARFLEREVLQDLLAFLES